MDEFKAAVYQGNLTGAVFSVLAKPLQSFSDIPLHVGIVGEPGSGKSSFINAMLGLSEGDPGAAQTGIQMTTVEAKDYPYPLLPQVILWDLPGKGASPFGEGIRAKQVDLSRFDFFIIVGAQRFRMTHSDLAHEIQRMGKRFYFVRTKADLDLEASRRQRPSSYSEEKVLQRIKEDCRECLIREGMRDPQVFLVSNWETHHFDFPLLRDKLEKDLSGLKRQAFLHKLPTACLPTLEKMQAAKKIWLTAMCSGVMAAIPVPGLSFLAAMFLFTRFRSQCHLDFGLDDPSLSALAQLVGKPTAAFKAVMKSLGIKPAVWWRLPDVVGAAVMIREYYYWRGFPIFGCVLSGGISLLTTYFMLRKCISDVAKDTQRVLTKALEAEEKKSI